jgi:phosphoribosylformylglycinamidine synthase I
MGTEMSPSTPRALILTGYGINCDRETEFAFGLAGGRAKRVHVNDLIDRHEKLSDYQILAVPGGFSYGDDIASGRVLANKLRTNLGDDVQDFVSSEKLIIGICNGFQVLVKSGLLPGLDNNYTSQTATLTFNTSGRYEDRWVHLSSAGNRCVFTEGISRLYLPVAHGEGRFTDGKNGGGILERLKSNSQIALVYCREDGSHAGGEFPWNPNGSEMDIAGICDPTGRVFGLMPHPERFLHLTHHPLWTRLKEDAARKAASLPEEGDGLQIFRNAVRYFG